MIASNYGDRDENAQDEDQEAEEPIRRLETEGGRRHVTCACDPLWPHTALFTINFTYCRLLERDDQRSASVSTAKQRVPHFSSDEWIKGVHAGKNRSMTLQAHAEDDWGMGTQRQHQRRTPVERHGPPDSTHAMLHYSTVSYCSEVGCATPPRRP